MKLAQLDDVELISIKRKSLKDVDNEIDLNVNKTRLNAMNGSAKFYSKSFPKKAQNNKDEFQFIPEPDEMEKKEENDDEHYESSVRYVKINKSPNGACGFHLTRTKWDPYPWVTDVDNFTPAAKSDLKAGDCVLEVNGCDVLGLRITEIAKLVKFSQHQVTLLLWSSNCNNKCDEESLCAAPMTRSLQRLSLVVQMILSLIECPVCLDTIASPAMQCQNGHLLCVNCRIRSEKCPVCRDRYFPRPALIAEQIQSAITSAFNLCHNEDKVRQKIFGRHTRQRQMVKETLQCLEQNQKYQQQQQPVYNSLAGDTQTKDVGATKTTTSTSTTNTCFATTSSTTTIKTINRKCDGKVRDKFFKSARYNSNDNKTTSNKFLTKLLSSKAHSMENLTNGHNNTATAATRNNIFNTCHTTITSAISQHELFDMKQQQKKQQNISSQKQVGECTTIFKDFTPRLQQQTSSVTNTNQFNDLPSTTARNHHCTLTYKPSLNAIAVDLNINTKLCCKQILINKMKRAALACDKDLTGTKESITCILESPRIFMNDANKTGWSPILCETSYATIPRAVKLKQKPAAKQAFCQCDVYAVKDAEEKSLKSHTVHHQ